MSATPSRTSGSGLTGLSDRQLARRVHHVSRCLDDLADRRLNIGAAAHGVGRGGGLDPVATMEHNRRLDREGGRADLERELAVLNEETKRREGSPEPETRSGTRRVLTAAAIAAIAAVIIFAVVILSDEGTAEPVPVDQWQPANIIRIGMGEEPYDLAVKVSCWPEVQVDSLLQTSQEIRISLIRRGPVEPVEPSFGRARTCTVMVRLRDVLGDRIVIDGTRDKEVTVG